MNAKIQLDKGVVPDNFDQLTKDVDNRLRPALEDADLVIAHNVCSLHKNLPLTVALHQISQQPSPPRMLLWHHDLAWTSARYQSELYNRYPWNLLRTAWPGVEQVAISDSRQLELAKLQGIPSVQIKVVPNGIDLLAFLRLGLETRQLVDQLHLLSAAPLLILPVRITARKNIELALLSMAELRKRNSSASLVITGPPGPHNVSNQEYFESLRALRDRLGLGSSVYFLADEKEDRVSDEVIRDLYKLADALFLPSLDEGFGIPILEAGLANIPIFCSDIPSLRALAGMNAFYFSPYGNPELIADLIAEKLEENPVYRHRVQVRQGYAWGSVYSKHIAPLLEKPR